VIIIIVERREWAAASTPRPGTPAFSCLHLQVIIIIVEKERIVCNFHMEARPSSLFLPPSASDTYYGGEGENGLQPPHGGQALQPFPASICK
jgi:hypothetical protein